MRFLGVVCGVVAWFPVSLLFRTRWLGFGRWRFTKKRRTTVGEDVVDVLVEGRTSTMTGSGTLLALELHSWRVLGARRRYR